MSNNNAYLEAAAVYEHALDSIAEVWGKYRHMDPLLTDTKFFGPGTSPQRGCLYDLWQAIRTAMAIVEGREL